MAEQKNLLDHPGPAPPYPTAPPGSGYPAGYNPPAPGYQPAPPAGYHQPQGGYNAPTAGYLPTQGPPAGYPPVQAPPVAYQGPIPSYGPAPSTTTVVVRTGGCRMCGVS